MEQPAGDDEEDELDSLQPYTDKSLGQLIAETENWLRDGSPLRESTPRLFKAHLEPHRFILFPPRARAARNPFPHPHHTIAHSLSLSVRAPKPQHSMPHVSPSSLTHERDASTVNAGTPA